MKLDAATIRRFAPHVAAAGIGVYAAKEGFQERKAAVLSHLEGDAGDTTQNVDEISGRKYFVNTGSGMLSEALLSAAAAVVIGGAGALLVGRALQPRVAAGAHAAVVAGQQRIHSVGGFATAALGSAMVLGSLGAADGALATASAYRELESYS